MLDIRLIVGLGNVGQQYKETRHNAGFWLLDQLSSQAFLYQPKFFCEKSSVLLCDRELIMIKPATLMNESGRSVSKFATYYDIKPHQILVVHDELDVPVGESRFKYGGGCGGHKGLLSIVSHLGVSTFYRLRIGIGRPKHQDVSSFVLGKPTADERELIEQTMTFITDHMGLLFSAVERFTQKLHSRRIS